MRFSRAPYGPMWGHMDPYEPIWVIWNRMGHMVHMDPYERIWTHVDPCGPIWVHVDPYGPYGRTWAHMVHMDPYVTQRCVTDRSLQPVTGPAD